MLCQMAENEGVALAGEAGVFPSLLPDNTPSGAGELLQPPLTSLPAGGGGGGGGEGQTLAGRGKKWARTGRNKGGRYRPRQDNADETRVETECG